jgi:hypothetical protein
LPTVISAPVSMITHTRSPSKAASTSIRWPKRFLAVTTIVSDGQEALGALEGPTFISSRAKSSSTRCERKVSTPSRPSAPKWCRA